MAIDLVDPIAVITLGMALVRAILLHTRRPIMMFVLLMLFVGLLIFYES